MNAKRRAEKAIRLSRKKLTNNVLGRAKIDSITWYGAVEIDTKHLVVWILLSGTDDDDLPEWFFGEPIPDLPGNQSVRLGLDFVELLSQVQMSIRADFASVGWPNSLGVRVGFDSSHRVEINGGWKYFK